MLAPKALQVLEEDFKVHRVSRDKLELVIPRALALLMF
jgi:hypothetical protein